MGQEHEPKSLITGINFGDGIILQADNDIVTATLPLIYPLGTVQIGPVTPKWTILATGDLEEASRMIAEDQTGTWDIHQNSEGGYLNAYSPGDRRYLVAGNDTALGVLKAVRSLKLMHAYESCDTMTMLHSSSGSLKGSGFIFASNGDEELGSGAGKTSTLFAMLTSVNDALYHSNDITAVTAQEGSSPKSPYIPEVLPLDAKMLEGLNIDHEYFQWSQLAGKYYGYPAELEQAMGVRTERDHLDVRRVFFVNLVPTDEETVARQIYEKEALSQFLSSVSLNRTKQASRENPLDPSSHRLDDVRSLEEAEKIFAALVHEGVDFWVLEGSVYPQRIRDALSHFVDI